MEDLGIREEAGQALLRPAAFPGDEQPAVLTDEIRAFFREVRKQGHALEAASPAGPSAMIRAK
jgi:hypothetical protein